MPDTASPKEVVSRRRFWQVGAADRLGPTEVILTTPQSWRIDWSQWTGWGLLALGLYFLTTLQATLCALTCDAQTGRRHHPNQEKIGQGIANFVVPFFWGGFPSLEYSLARLRAFARAAKLA